MPPIYTLTTTTPPPDPTPALSSPSHSHILAAYTDATHKKQYMLHSHRNNHTHNIGYHDNLADSPRTTAGLQTPHKHTYLAVKVREIILQDNINGIKKQTRGAQTAYSRHTCRYHHNSGTRLTSKGNTPKVHNSQQCATIGCTRQEVGSSHSLETTNILSTINTHNTELQMVKVHINNTKHIAIGNIYIHPRDSTSTHYKSADTEMQHSIQHITNIPHSVLTGDVNAHSALWH